MSKGLLIGLGVAGGIFLLFRKKNSGFAGLGEARHQLYSMPRKWWVPDPSKGQKNCFQNKTEALMAFAAFNFRVIDNFQGIAHDESPAEFDAINVKYGLTGKDRVTNISQALWVAMPPGRPYCLTNIDVDTLNRTSPAKEDPQGVGFQVPDFAEVDKISREQAEFFRRQQEDERAQSGPVPF